MDKLKMQSMNKVQGNIEKIRVLFPNAVTEVKRNGKVELAVDFNVLKQELADTLVDDRELRYQFTWPDKQKSVLLANSSINKTLRPCREESVDFDNTQNLYIEGDNLEVLKLLQETYLGKIKMIYIDPPYNTGNDFVYNDDFAMSAQDYSEVNGDFDEDGNRLFLNTESNGRFHTDWLNMIYPRLRLAKDLLSDAGVIFISIDDNEVENLKKVCSEIFGLDNFLAEFPRVTKKGGKSTDTYAKNHDYVLTYCKNINVVRINGIAHIDDGFKYKDEYFEKRGAYKLNQTLDYNTLQYNKTMDYEIELDGKVYVPGGDLELQKQRHNGKHGKHDWVWRWSKKLFDFGYKNGWIEISKSGRIYTKTYLNATIDKDANDNYFIKYSERTKPISTLDFTDNNYSNDNSNKEITGLMGSALFDYVKPTSLVKMLMSTCTRQNDIVFDFFSGSATTAHAVMQLNAEDGGNRKFIMVQLPELCDEKSEAYKAGYKNICEIGKERIRRAGTKIKKGIEELNSKPIYITKNESGQVTTLFDTANGIQVKGKDLTNLIREEKTVPDIGFRVLKLDESNMQSVYYHPEEYTQTLLDGLEDNIKPDRTPLDLLFQVMLELGKPLSAKIEEKDIAGKKIFSVDDGDLIACFDSNVSEEVVTAIAKLQPLYAVFRDSSMASDSVAANFEQIFATYSPTTTRKVL